MQHSTNGDQGMKKSVARVTMTVSETALMVGVSPTTIREMVRQGQIPHVRVRSRILFHADVIDEWLRGTAPSSSL